MKVFNQKQLAISLLLLSALPFPLLAVNRLNGFFQTTQEPSVILHVYTAIMTAFISGSQWSIHFCKRTQDSVYLLTGVIVLLVLGSLLQPGTSAGLVLVMIAFVLTWAIEFSLSRQRVTTVWYWRTRSLVSCTAIASLLFTLASS